MSGYNFDDAHTETLIDIDERLHALACPELEGYDDIVMSELTALCNEVGKVMHSRRPQVDRDPDSFTYGCWLGEDCAIRERAEVMYWDMQYDMHMLSERGERLY